MTTPLRGRPTRDEAAELEERLRRAAVEEFLDRGYEATTMESVAKAAGITKRTLYARYPDKEALFRAAIWWAMTQLSWQEPTAEEMGDDLETALLAIGRSVLARARDPEMVRISRLAMTESQRVPEFAASAQSVAWSPRMRSVMELLDRQVQAGTISVDDIELTAEAFIALVAVMPARLATFGVFRTVEEEERHLHHAVQLFLHGVLVRKP